MRVQYIITENEIRAARNKLYELKQAALLSRDAGEAQDNREFYLRAKGFEDALLLLGIIQPERR